jgi:hypothetical protein
MEENNENQDQDWLQKLKDGLNNPKADIWNLNKIFDLEEEIEVEGQKKYVKIEETPEIKKELDAKRLETLRIQAEEDFKRKQSAEKAIAEHEKKQNDIVKKQKAEQKKSDNKIKDFQKTLLSKGIKGYDSPKFDVHTSLILAETNRRMRTIFDNEGNMIISADEIQFGNKGLFYIFEYFLDVYNLYHYDITKSKIELLAKFNSVKDLKKSIYKQDPNFKLGFNLWLDYNTQKEFDEEIRLSKLSPIEKQKEIKAKKQIETDKKKKQKQQELERLQKVKTKGTGDDEFDKLFGN